MLKLNHLTGFGSGAGAAAGGDVTSYVFDGTDDILGVPDHATWDRGTGDWTVEFWFKGTATSGAIVARWDTGTPAKSFEVYVGGSKLVGAMSTDGNATVTTTTGTTNVNDDVWHHGAYIRNGNVQTLYVDGVSEGTPGSATGVWFTSAAEVTVGAQGTVASPNFFYTGNVDEVRISDIARETGNFTPQTEQYTSDANTLLLIHSGEDIVSGTTGSGATFVDSGNTGHTVTENGNAIRDTSIYKF